MSVARMGKWVVAVAMICGATVASAAPWSKLFTKVDCDPNKEYKLTDLQGPWMIMACSFSGEKAFDQAHELVLEIRKKHHVTAYVYEKVFDYSGDFAGLGVNRYGEQRRARYQRAANQQHYGGDGKFREMAVLVGDFLEVDDPDAQKLLEKIKYAQFDCLKIKDGRQDSRSLGFLREMQREVNKMAGAGHKEKALKGPLGMAFLTTNPKLPDSYFVPQGLDPLVVQMNKGVTHSLINCPGRYSVKIATFNGAVVIDPKKIKDTELGLTNTKSKLEDAAIKAHQLTESLRKSGYDAWEFHDRYASMVTVGTFQSLGPNVDGTIKLDPQIKQLIEIFGPEKPTLPGQTTGKPHIHAGIQLDFQPMVVEVPRQSVASTFDRAQSKFR